MSPHVRTISLVIVAFSAMLCHADETQGPAKAVGVEAIQAADHVGEQRYALIIGINDYADPQIPDLTTCENDAAGLHALLIDPQVGGVAVENATLLRGVDATTRNVKRALNDLRRVPRDATVFVYFSGHGAKEAGEAFWVTHDAELGDLAISALPDRDIRAFLGRIPSQRVVVMIDACYAAATIKEQKTIVDLSDALRAFTGTGRAVLSAAGSGEEAIEANDLKHSVFTYYLLAGLKGSADDNGDGVVVLPELTTYIDRHVADEARKRGGIQRPTVDFQGVQEPAKFALAIDATVLGERLRETAQQRELRQRRLAAVERMYLDEKLSLELARLAQRLLQSDADTLDDADTRRLRYVMAVADGELAPDRLAAALALIDDTVPEKPVHDAFAGRRAARAQPDFATGGQVVFPLAHTSPTLTPLVSSDNYASRVQNLVLESLATLDPETLEWRALLAQSWQVGDDGLTLTFDLRKDPRFSDGTPVTAHDIVYTFELIMNDELPAPRMRAYYEKIEAVEAQGPHRIVFRFGEPYFKAFELCAGMPVLARHYYERHAPSSFADQTLLFGSGPYVLTTDDGPDGDIVLVRNDRYWGVPAALDRVVFRQTPSDDYTQAFREGRVDLIHMQPTFYKQLLGDAAFLTEAQPLHYTALTNGYQYIGWNQRRDGKPTAFADRRVRQAMTLLIDRRSMVQELYAGYATVATGPFHSQGPQRDPAIQPWPHDPHRARQLLDAAGYRDRNGDGILEDAAGRPLRFTLTYPAGVDSYEAVISRLEPALKASGVVLVPDAAEWSVLIDRINRRDFDAIALGWTGSIESDAGQLFHSEQIAEGDNHVNYRNPQLDRLIDEARATVDAETRMPLWHAVHRILHEDQPYTFLFSQDSLCFVRKNVANVRPTRLGLNGLTEWYIPRDAQRP